MKRYVIAALVSLGAVVTALAADYEVTIEDHTYLFSNGVQQEVLLKDGKRIAIKVKASETKPFREHGLSFDYPTEMKLTQESFYGIKQISLESTDSTIVLVQLFPAGATPAEIQRDLLAGFHEEFANLGARFPAKATAPCKRSIGGIVHQGVVLSYALGDMGHKSEFYTLKRGDKNLAIMFQCADEDADKAIPRFDIVSNSFK